MEWKSLFCISPVPQKLCSVEGAFSVFYLRNLASGLAGRNQTVVSKLSQKLIFWSELNTNFYRLSTS